jgi:hypothetical protein
VQVVTITEDGGAMRTIDVEVPEALCGVRPDGGQASGDFCSCEFSDPVGSGAPANTGAILAQSIPGTFMTGGTSGQVQVYVLINSVDNEILQVNYTGLFTGLANTVGDTLEYAIYAINYRVEDEDLFEQPGGFLLPGENFQPILNGFNGNGLLADACFAVCLNNMGNPVTYEVNCPDLVPTDVTLMECPMFEGDKVGMFNLLDALDGATISNTTDAAVNEAFVTQPVSTTVTFHTSYEDALAGTGAIAEDAGPPVTVPYQAVSGTVVYARILVEGNTGNTDNEGCVYIAEVTLMTKLSPSVDPATLELCAGIAGGTPETTEGTLTIAGHVLQPGGIISTTTPPTLTLISDGGTGFTTATNVTAGPTFTNPTTTEYTIDVDGLDPGTVTLEYIFYEEVTTADGNASMRVHSPNHDHCHQSGAGRRRAFGYYGLPGAGN